MNAARRNYRSRTPCGPHPPASARRLVLRAAFTPGATTTGAPGAARRPQRDQSQQLQDLIKEVVETAVSTGPRGVMRSLQAAQVVAQLVGEYAAAGRVDPPQVRAAARPPAPRGAAAGAIGRARGGGGLGAAGSRAWLQAARCRQGGGQERDMSLR